jgi:uncharacterized DUF497 family protein
MEDNWSFEWDEVKRRANLEKHRLDFDDAWLVLSDVFLKMQARSVGDEVRYRAVGYVRQNLVAIVYTMRGETFRIISMRKARDDERRLYDQEVQSR